MKISKDISIDTSIDMYGVNPISSILLRLQAVHSMRMGLNARFSKIQTTTYVYRTIHRSICSSIHISMRALYTECPPLFTGRALYA